MGKGTLYSISGSWGGSPPRSPTGSTVALASPWVAFSSFVILGIEHILSGWDHLVFLGVLLLMAGLLFEVVAVVTGFTVGHSITLACAVLGWATPQTAGVEALIGLSIALVAVENHWLLGERRGFLLPCVSVGAIFIMAALTSFTGAISFEKVSPGETTSNGIVKFLIFSALIPLNTKPPRI